MNHPRERDPDAAAGPTPRASPLLGLFRRFSAWPAGRWLFSRAVCWKAPYFASIAPRVERLDAGHCEVRLRDRRRVHNHIGTVHAIALCNAAELAAGLMTEATLPPRMRWIPKGMQVNYLKKAVGTQRVIAEPEFAPGASDSGYELPVSVRALDGSGDTTFTASVRMWVSPKRT
jgi:acyl-coenzyme A thioesterase PaaI-like protein